MKHHKYLIALLASLFVVLAACNTTDQDSATDPDNDTEMLDPSEDEDSNGIDNEADQGEVPDDPNEEVEGLREAYLARLNETRDEVEEMRENLEDDTTAGMLAFESERFEAWDALLNEIYNTLEEQLSEGEMEELREEQREWIDYRDETAEEAAEEYEGGSMESLERIAVLANLTEDRSYELVENYME
ncbi:Protein of unknown function [Amphibacillus marinus]|uniref:Lysozyme inhibitor LprI-like N-terminal domain-containing protein n=1 Tax=Amphibacillus marinus TaxID=872970 RepID=A0A1H8KI64_9BACI|nr:lysozyme inhibitor LprI family protein [Amphibacillus marinus]SEN92653.1 Protein of unknown function [Amphibacillus marinus]